MWTVELFRTLQYQAGGGIFTEHLPAKGGGGFH